MRIKNEYEFTWNVANEEKTIVCIATPTRLDGKLVDAIYNCHKLTGKFPKSYKNDFAFIGKANLKDGDVHNLQLAQNIARAKALRKANKEMAKIMKEAADVFYKKYSFYADISYDTKEEADRQDEKIVSWISKDP